MNDPEPRESAGPDENGPEPQEKSARHPGPELLRGGSGPRRRGGRRDGGGQLVVICWRDIPAQVNAGSGDNRTQRILPRRFQRAIDRAAMVAGKTEASQYVGEWRRVVRPGNPADPASAALEEAARLEDEFPRSRLDAFVATGGWDPDADDSPKPDQNSEAGPKPDRDPGTEAIPTEQNPDEEAAL